MKTFTEDLNKLGEHYSKLVTEHGDDPRSAQQTDRATQEKRMEILAGVGDLRTAKIFDFGCGTGHLLNFLKGHCGYAGEYLGCDLTEEILGVARKCHPEAKFIRRDVLAEGIGEEVDFALVSGTFNNLIGDNWGFITSALGAMFPSVKQGLAFNLISSYVDFFDKGLYYADPEAVFRFCKEKLSTRVTLRHDYQIKAGVLPYEFTVYVYKDAIPCRKNKRHE